MAGTTVVCGLDRLSLPIVLALRSLGEHVTVVAEAPRPALLRAAAASGARVVQGSSEEIAQLEDVDLLAARCLVLTESADLNNLQVALAAREVNPDVRIVMRMFSTELAERASRLLPNSRVVSASREAAPYFAADALGLASVPTRHVWGRHLALHPAGADGHLVELDGGMFLAPIEPPRLIRRRRSLHLRELRRAARALFDLRLAATGGALVLLVALSVTVFHAALHLRWVDAIYFTVTTAATVGYGDINLQAAPDWLKLYGSLFMILSAISVALLFALAADAVIGSRILEALGVPRPGMRGHVVVVGLGNTGHRIVQHLLDAGVDVAAAERSQANRFVGDARRHGVPVLVADGRYRDSLRALSVEGARAVIAATDDDLANLETALTARELNAQARIVVRLFDPELADRARAQLGLDACHSVPVLAMPAFVAAALGEGVLSTFEHGSRLWVVAELWVRPGSRADGAATASLEATGDLHVLAVRDRKEERWRPAHPDRLEAGHQVLLAATRERWEGIRALTSG
ncbi:MAG TPA: NAD-binding protein [Terriglobales bacterium]|nr:NAD-binding protein [Terriglobales bacterium]